MAIDNETKEGLVQHMKDFGLHMIGKGLVNATFAEILNPYNHAMSVIHLAHGTEIIFKARIAEVHPLLIFSKIPKKTDELLNISTLFVQGQTLMYNELPDRLWASTGYSLQNLAFYHDFGKLRNQLTHFAIPDHVDLAEESLRFGFGVVEKAVNDWWDETLLDYACEYDSEYLEYVFEQLERLNILVNYETGPDSVLVKKRSPNTNNI